MTGPPGAVDGRRAAPFVAIDTSGAEGSVAVARGAEVLARRVIGERMEQAARLVPALDEALAAARVDRSEIGGLVVGEGPGSFTGVRVAAATAKGLAHALGIPLRAISSLAAAALANDVGHVRYALFDARADRVYGACYGVGAGGVQCLVPPHGGTLRDVLAGDVPPGSVFVGDGALRHRAAIEGAGFPVASPGRSATLAEGLVRYLALEPGLAPVADLRSWEPAYVRPSSAVAP
jgi:tRNA threonylcarbamoyladenosine biosynthesis protein TsaB